MSKREVRRIVTDALDRMVTEDAHLFKISVNERTLTNRLAIYLQAGFPNWHVDCEYNRHGDVPKRLLGLPRKRKNVFPDVIVHERGATGPNLLVVEAKKSSDLNKENEAFDYIKLRAYRDELGYRNTVFIVFFDDGEHPAYTVDFTLMPRPKLV